VKVYINPHPNRYHEDGQGSGGIWRVISAQGRWLPEYGIEIVGDEGAADVVVVHAGMLVRTEKPIVTTNHGLYWTGDYEWPERFWQFNGAVIEALRRAPRPSCPANG